eukprot:TRINITY_DN6914_c1_g3_i3.p2 TRINITY_DN6914_c1_g3~~TRINITY_DN6914_c1_g3_i3.p2  ORF type:complete len:125 (-),score=1.45 TRINITY_DN6914_c1_g3_i3:36-410(-)
MWQMLSIRSGIIWITNDRSLNKFKIICKNEKQKNQNILGMGILQLNQKKPQTIIELANEFLRIGVHLQTSSAASVVNKFLFHQNSPGAEHGCFLYTLEFGYNEVVGAKKFPLLQTNFFLGMLQF